MCGRKNEGTLSVEASRLRASGTHTHAVDMQMVAVYM